MSRLAQRPQVGAPARRAPRRAAQRRGSVRAPVDAVLAATVIALIGFGVVMVYSASAVAGDGAVPRPAVLPEAPGRLRRRRRSLLMWAASRVDYHRLYKLTYPRPRRRRRAARSCASSGFGHSGGGAARWLVDRARAHPARRDGQARARHLARLLARQEGRAGQDVHRRVPPAPHRGRRLHAALPEAARLRQRGRARCSSRSRCSSSRARRSATSSARRSSAARFGAAAIRFREYRYERYLAWLHMDEHRQDLAYQPFQSVMSFGSGGPVGPRPRARPADALPARGAHRLRRRDRRRGARLPRRRRALRRVPAPRGARRARGAARAGRLRRLPGLRALDDVRRAGAREPGGRARDPADEGADACRS